MAAVPVTYLWNRSCPSHAEGLELLRRVAESAGVELALTTREVTSDQEAAALRFPGSPTYLVAGRDIAPPPAGVPFAADGCRAYTRPGGRIGPLPDAATLTAALTAAAAPDPPEDA
ncbi:MAG TPA: hypothetical protein VNT51_12920 [Miltoncostaeaceae bacterium]|nr:hypothetical protein [Miltoncostaeaceae bacterium]